MGLLNRFVWIFVSPSKVFADIKDGKAAWWQPWVWLSVIYVIVGYFSKPVQLAVMELNPSNLPPDQLDKQLEIMAGWGYWLQLAATPVILLVMGLAVAGLSYILVSILADRASFKQFFSLNIYAGIVASAATVLATLVVRMKGIDAIQSAADAKFSIGLAFLAPEEGALIRAVLSSVDFFSIWSYVLVVMGVMYIFDMPRRQAIYCVIPLWVMAVLFLIIAEVTGGMG
jgi:hypothetical protein